MSISNEKIIDEKFDIIIDFVKFDVFVISIIVVYIKKIDVEKKINVKKTFEFIIKKNFCEKFKS